MHIIKKILVGNFHQLCQSDFFHYFWSDPQVASQVNRNESWSTVSIEQRCGNRNQHCNIVVRMPTWRLGGWGTNPGWSKPEVLIHSPLWPVIISQGCIFKMETFWHVKTFWSISLTWIEIALILMNGNG